MAYLWIIGAYLLIASLVFHLSVLDKALKKLYKRVNIMRRIQNGEDVGNLTEDLDNLKDGSKKNRR